jgi:hypothetical protein
MRLTQHTRFSHCLHLAIRTCYQREVHPEISKVPFSTQLWLLSQTAGHLTYCVLDTVAACKKLIRVGVHGFQDLQHTWVSGLYLGSEQPWQRPGSYSMVMNVGQCGPFPTWTRCDMSLGNKSLHPIVYGLNFSLHARLPFTDACFEWALEIRNDLLIAK